jgi:hypothetical protein
VASNVLPNICTGPFSQPKIASMLLAALFLFYSLGGADAALQDFCVDFSNTPSVYFDCPQNTILWSIDASCSSSKAPDPCKDANQTSPCPKSLNLFVLQGCLGETSCGAPMPEVGTLTLIIHYACQGIPPPTAPTFYVVPDTGPDGNCTERSPCTVDTALLNVCKRRRRKFQGR